MSHDHAFSVLLRVPILRGICPPDHCHLDCDQQPVADGEPVFVFVHGTWARHASWTQRESTLGTAVLTKWPGAGFYRFNWTGVNGLRHRRAAAARLAQELARLQQEYPCSKVVAIGHSHGGTVVCWATTLLSAPIEGSIYLNTPFPQVFTRERDSKPAKDTARNDSKLAKGTTTWMVLNLFLLLCPIPLVSLLLYWDIIDNPLWLWAAFVPTLWPIWTSAQTQVDLRREGIIDFVEKFNAYATAFRRVDRELSLFVVGDEANAMLTFTYFVQWLGFRAAAVTLLIGLLFGVAAVVSLFVAPDPILFIKLLMASTFLLIFIALFLVGAVLISHGFEHARFALTVAMTTVPAPPGFTRFVTVPWEPETEVPLWHSFAYQSKLATASIIQWLAENPAIRHQKLYTQH